MFYICQTIDTRKCTHFIYFFSQLQFDNIGLTVNVIFFCYLCRKIIKL